MTDEPAGENSAVEIGMALSADGYVEAAEACWRHAAQAGDARAMFTMGMHLAAQHGNPAAAEPWWRRAGEAGHQAAMMYLGVLMYVHGQLADAETWLEAAAGDLRDPQPSDMESFEIYQTLIEHRMPTTVIWQWRQTGEPGGPDMRCVFRSALDTGRKRKRLWGRRSP